MRPAAGVAAAIVALGLVGGLDMRTRVLSDRGPNMLGVAGADPGKQPRSLNTPRRIEGIGIRGWHDRAVRNRRIINTQRQAIRWLKTLVPRHRTLSSASTGLQYWIDRQIRAANIIGRESGGDPWPNCPDPFDGGGSWYATVQCENGGNWLDSPGYFRCGLQFDPMWERRFGRLCP